MNFPDYSNSGIKLPIRPEGIAFDLDGTLLDYDGRLSDPVAKAVRLIANAGIKVFLITGRQESGALRHWEAIGLDTPIATCNGAYVGFPGKEPFLHIRLSDKARGIILDLERQNDLYVQYYVDNHVYSLRDDPERDMYSRQFSPVELIPGDDVLLARRLPTKCLCITPENEQKRVCALFEEALGGEAVITQSNERFIEIMPAGADKAAGLRALADWAKIPVDRFIAVGDAKNDLPMLGLAGFAITFKSGNPELFDQVDMILPPLWEDGMDILAKCVLGMTGSGRFLTPRSSRFFKK